MKEISVQELKEVLAKKEKNMAVIDVRSVAEHTNARIADVVNMPLDEIEKHADKLRQFDTVYIHCQSGNRSGQACQYLEKLGLTNTVNVRGGILEWEREGFEVCRNTGCKMPVMQQVLLAAGSLILSGFLLAAFVHPYFLLLPLIAGAGLTFAGATGKCFLMMLLLRMPWNKQ